jgi:hypothetical protein
MIEDGKRIELVTDEELSRVRGGSIWSWLTTAARWIKDHVVIGLKNVGIKGKL